MNKASALDDILSSALEDFDDDDDIALDTQSAKSDSDSRAKSSVSSSAQAGRASLGKGKEENHEGGGESSRKGAKEKKSGDASKLTDDEVDRELNESMAKLMADMQTPEFQKSLEETFRSLGAEGVFETGDATLERSQKENAQDKSVKAGKKDADSDSEDIDKNVAKTLEMLAEASNELEGVDSAAAEGMGEEMMAEMMKEFEKMAEKEDFDQVINQMMTQLLSKEIMYEPIKQICEKYPEWLADNEENLSKEDYEKYGRQYQYFQQLVLVYETDPTNYGRLMELMQETQECGQPPAEIVKNLAPGLEWDGQGMPIMPNMGPGMMGGFPGFPGGAGNEQCSLM